MSRRRSAAKSPPSCAISSASRCGRTSRGTGTLKANDVHCCGLFAPVQVAKRPQIVDNPVDNVDNCGKSRERTRQSAVDSEMHGCGFARRRERGTRAGGGCFACSGSSVPVKRFVGFGIAESVFCGAAFPIRSAASRRGTLFWKPEMRCGTWICRCAAYPRRVGEKRLL